MDFLVVDDNKTFREAACFLIEAEGHYAEPAGCGQAALANLKEENFDAVLLDVNLDGENGLDLLPQFWRSRANIPVVMLTAEGNVGMAVEAMRRGALDFLEKPFTREQFHRALGRAQQFNQMSRSLERLEGEARETKSQSPELLLDFTTPQMLGIMEVLTRAARSPASILLLGESGTGKSVLARAVHEQSRLHDKPFVTVSCPSLSKELLESELFGHVKGSFTGAVNDRWGKVKAAAGGTLFLDEIGDLPMEIQPKLLRLLQEREYERLGENITRLAEVRIIAATNRDLKKQMVEGAFREDLYFRLNVITVEVPPLRSRPGDLERFAEHHLKHFSGQCARSPRRFSAEALDRIRRHSWPGNLRELRNTIERAVILAKGDKEIEAVDLALEGSDAFNGGQTMPQAGEMVTLENLQATHIRKVIEQTDSIAAAAKILGVDQATVYRKRKKAGLEPVHTSQLGHVP